MLKDLRSRMVSGKVYRTGRPIPSAPDERIVYLVLGSQDGALNSFLSSGLARQNLLRTVVAPRTVQLATRPGRRVKNTSYEEALAARSGKLVSRVLEKPEQVHGEHFAFDLTPWATLCSEVLANASPQARHEEMIRNLSEAMPAIPEGYRVALVLVAGPGVDAAHKRLTSISSDKRPTDHVLYSIVNGEDAVKKLDPEPFLTFLLSPDGRRAARLDATDQRTAGVSKMATALASIEADFTQPPDQITAITADAATAAVETAARRAGVEPTMAHGPRAAALERMKDAADRAAAKLPPEATQDDVEKALDEDPDFVSAIAELVSPPLTGEDRRRKERIDRMRSEQGSAPVTMRDGSKATVSELLKDSQEKSLKVPAVPGTFLAPEVSKPTFSRVTTAYVESGEYDRDLARVITSVSRVADTPYFVNGIERTDISDSMNLKEEVSVSLRTETGRNITLNFEVPKLTRDGYLFLNGTKHSISKQIVAMPIIKVRPDQVLVTTAYNKAIVARFGQNASPRSTAVRAVLARLSRETLPKGVRVVKESAVAANSDYVSAPEYDAIAKSFLSVVTPQAEIYFSRQQADRVAAERFKWATPIIERGEREGVHPIGVMTQGSSEFLIMMAEDGTLCTVGKDGVKGSPVAIDEFIFGLLTQAGVTVPQAPSASARKYAYSRVMVLSQNVPLIVLLGIGSGLMPTLDRAGTGARFIDKEEAKRRLKTERNLDAIEFQDGTVVYPTKRMRDTMLVNGLKDLDTSEYSISDFGPNGRGWVDYAALLLGTPGHAKGLVNIRNALIDPMTAEVLADMGLPTDFDGVMLHCNTLLETNEHKAANDLANYRIRGPELINALIYKAIHRELEAVRRSSSTAAPARLSVARNRIITDVLQASNVEELAELNPLLEAEMIGKATWTGAAGGVGDARMVTREMRAYDESFRGVFGYYSPDNNKIGVNRSLSYGAMVKSTRGYLDPGAGSKATELLALGELMSPFTSLHADPPRIGMQSKQATHTMPVMKHSPQLVGSGAERALAHLIGNTFAYKARDAGVIEAIDEKNAVVRLRHPDKTVSYIDLRSRSVKNSSGGLSDSHLTP